MSTRKVGRLERLVVAKFGGTSMANAKAIKQSAKVAILNKAAVVVVSATSGTTNQLSELADNIGRYSSARLMHIVKNIRDQHDKIAKDLSKSDVLVQDIKTICDNFEKLIAQVINKNRSALLDELYSNVKDKTLKNASKMNVDFAGQPRLDNSQEAQAKKLVDKILAVGEQLSSTLMVEALSGQGVQSELIDSREIIKTDNHHGSATPLIKEISLSAKKQLLPKLKTGIVLVTQGFVGESPEKVTTTLGRGGSDYTAALIAEAINASQLQIWTDVNGIASTDPRITTNAERIDTITFQEASELATSGAKILYTKSIVPVRRANIPIFVGNTFDPSSGGTTVAKQTSHKPLVRAIVLKKNQSIITLTTHEMAHQVGYLAKLFEVFASHKVSLDQISTSEISIAVALEDSTLLNKSLVKDLEDLAEVKVEKGLSVISIIGNDVNNTPGLARNIFNCLEESGDKIAIRMICQGASKHNFCFVVADRHGSDAVRKLHSTFIENKAKQ